MGGTGALVAGPGRPDRGAGRRRSAATRRCARSSSTDGAATGVRLASGEDDRGRHRGVQRRFRLDLSPSAAARRAAPLDRPADRARALLDEPVRLVLRHAPPYPDVPHHTILLGPRYRELLTTSSSARCWPTTSASTCTARPQPTRRWRRRAAMPSTCCRRCRTWRAAPTGAREAEPYRQRIARHLERHRAARARRRRSSPRGC